MKQSVYILECQPRLLNVAQVDIQKITFPAKNHVPVTEATGCFVKGKKLPEIMGSLNCARV